jgi:hypothetical protein
MLILHNTEQHDTDLATTTYYANLVGTPLRKTDCDNPPLKNLKIEGGLNKRTRDAIKQMARWIKRPGCTNMNANLTYSTLL